jgi:DNA polymerase-2
MRRPVNELSGWLLDVYDNHHGEITLLFLDEEGERYLFTQDFPVTFFAAGKAQRLRLFWAYLEKYGDLVHLFRGERQDLFVEQPVTVCGVQVNQTHRQQAVFQDVQAKFPDLTYYDADVPLSLRHAARFGTHPFAYCRLLVDEQGRVLEIELLESAWEVDPRPIPLRVMTLSLDVAPVHTRPTKLLVFYNGKTFRFPLSSERLVLVNLAALLRRENPDILLTDWGDTWLLPQLMEMSERRRIPLRLNRDEEMLPLVRPPHSYFSYGRILHRGQQVHLFGRLHVDRRNAMFWGDYELDGAIETARVTGMTLQSAVRLSSGTGINSMEIITALRQDILVPWHKQQVEKQRSALDLIRSDRGGMVYQPLVGLHWQIGEIDFISMYPAIMVRANISPEIKSPKQLDATGEPPGLIPQTIGPLLEKRIALKMRSANFNKYDPRLRHDKALTSAHKWLLVTCFGYLGYKNARFGQIEAHEAVTAIGREALLRAKEAAEDLGFELIHMYVDGLWVFKPEAKQPVDYQPLLNEITERTGISISLEGIYRWVCFLPSRNDKRVPVANRYFGVYLDGSIKMRGIETRRHDTPKFIADAQVALIEALAPAQTPSELPVCLEKAVEVLRSFLKQLRTAEAPLNRLLVTQRISRELDDYVTPSPGARAARQLGAVGKALKPGQRVRFVYTVDQDGVHAWDLPEKLQPKLVDWKRYQYLLLLAAETVLEPFGLDKEALILLCDGIPARQNPLPGMRPYLLRGYKQGALYEKRIG